MLEQLDLLGEEVVPVLRKEFAVGRPADVPAAPTHESLPGARAAQRPTRAGPTQADRVERMTRRMKLAIISGGLREPSSTRLLADRLAAAVRGELEPPATRSSRRSSSCARWAARSWTRC